MDECSICLEKLKNINVLNEIYENDIINTQNKELTIENKMYKHQPKSETKSEKKTNKKNKNKKYKLDNETMETNITNKTIKLNCGHEFHLHCIKKVKNNSCPLCRQKIITFNICPENHNMLFHTSTFNKKGVCRYCNKLSLDYCLKNSLF